MTQVERHSTADTMVNFTVRIPTTMRRQIEALAERDRRKPSEWARVQMEDAVRRGIEGDESGDVPHEQVVAEMWANGMITAESEARAKALTHEDFIRAQDEYEEERAQGWT